MPHQVPSGITVTECLETSPSWALLAVHTAQAESRCSHCASRKVSGVCLSP